MKKIKKVSLKTVQKNLLTIGAIISIALGTLKELMNFFQGYSKKAAEVIASRTPTPPVGTHTLATNHEWTSRVTHHVHSGFEGWIWQIKIWAMHHWNLVLIGVGILVIVVIIFLVDEIKDKIEEAKK